MSRLIAAALVCIVLVTAVPTRSFAQVTRNPVVGDTFSLSQPDKRTHLITSGMLTLGAIGALRTAGAKKVPAYLIAMLFTLSVTSVKELYFDRVYSQGDQVANVVGTAAGGAVAFSLRF